MHQPEGRHSIPFRGSDPRQLRPPLVLRLLRDKGFEATASVGSHLRIEGPDGRRTTLPLYDRQLPGATLDAIERDLGVVLR